MFKYFVLGAVASMAGSFATIIFMTHNPAMCRGVVVSDIKAHQVYMKQLTSVMPIEPQQDFLTTLTKGR